MTRHQALFTLGLNTNAKEADIRAAWHKKAKVFHPDSSCADIHAFLQARLAFETLVPPAPQAFRVRAVSRVF